MTTTKSWPSASAIAWPSLLWIGALHLGALLAFVPSNFSWTALGVCLVLHWLTGGIGICMTYHRLLTHRSFAIRPRWLEYVLTAIGCCASEGGPIGWVADHRNHHAHSDDEHDVHSPKRGFAWAHMFWWMTPDVTSRHTPEYYKKWAPDLYKDPVHRWIDSYQIVFPILLFAALYAFGGMSWLIWGGFVRTIFVLHTTWLVNSATHVWGYRTHETRDCLDEPLVGRPADLRRGLAQQPSRLPDLRPPRPAVVGSGYDLRGHPRPVGPWARSQRQASRSFSRACG